ncbi:MAG: hypothetical protein ACD_46C00333G0002, partial [uncultured bacterium]
TIPNEITKEEQNIFQPIELLLSHVQFTYQVTDQGYFLHYAQFQSDLLMQLAANPARFADEKKNTNFLETLSQEYQEIKYPYYDSHYNKVYDLRISRKQFKKHFQNSNPFIIFERAKTEEVIQEKLNMLFEDVITEKEKTIQKNWKAAPSKNKKIEIINNYISTKDCHALDILFRSRSMFESEWIADNLFAKINFKKIPFNTNIFKGTFLPTKYIRHFIDIERSDLLNNTSLKHLNFDIFKNIDFLKIPPNTVKNISLDAEQVKYFIKEKRFDVLTEVKLDHVILKNIDFDETDFQGADLTSSTFLNCNVQKVKNLNQAILTNSIRIEDNKLKDTVLNNAVVIRLIDIATEHTELKETLLKNADLGHINLSKLDLSGFNLSGASLMGTDLTGANIDNACFDIKTKFANMTIRQAKGENVRFQFSSTIDPSRTPIIISTKYNTLQQKLHKQYKALTKKAMPTTNSNHFLSYLADAQKNHNPVLNKAIGLVFYDLLKKEVAEKITRDNLLVLIEIAKKLGVRPDLSNFNLSGIDLSKFNLRYANLSNVTINNETNFSGANLYGVDLSNIKNNIKFEDVLLDGAQVNLLADAKKSLENANLRDAKLQKGTDLAGAKLNNIIIGKNTRFNGARLYTNYKYIVERYAICEKFRYAFDKNVLENINSAEFVEKFKKDYKNSKEKQFFTSFSTFDQKLSSGHTGVNALRILEHFLEEPKSRTASVVRKILFELFVEQLKKSETPVTAEQLAEFGQPVVLTIDKNQYTIQLPNGTPLTKDMLAALKDDDKIKLKNKDGVEYPVEIKDFYQTYCTQYTNLRNQDPGPRFFKTNFTPNLTGTPAKKLSEAIAHVNSSDKNQRSYRAFTEALKNIFNQNSTPGASSEVSSNGHTA